MGSNPKRGVLSPAERAEVQRLGLTGNHTQRQLAARFGVSKSTILRVMREIGIRAEPRGPVQPVQQETKPKPKAQAPAQAKPPVKDPMSIETSEPLPPPRPAPDEIPKDPILYREHKLREIVHDMAQTRQRGSMHVLPQFHRLEMSIHDELGKMRTEAAEITAEMGADGLVSTIVSTLHRLPPVLRHRIQEQLEALTTGAVIVLPGVADDDADGEEYGYSLQAMANSLLALEDETKENPLRFAVFTPPQETFLKQRCKFYLLRGGNQVGKSYVGAAETIWRCIGGHPFKPTKAPPITAWIVCHSWSQSLVIQEKVNDLIPPAELHPDMEFVRGKGFRGTGSPVVRFRNGSIIRFRTTQQSGAGRGTIALASGTVDWIWVDEPPPPQAWSEIAARVLRTRGSVGITMTPVGVPVDYLRKMCEAGQIVDIPAPLTLENVTPAGCRPLLTQAEIDQMASSYLKFDRAVRMEGSWEGFTPDGVIFESFRDEMISDVRPRGGEWRMAVGIDHGSGEASQCAVLVAIQIPDPRKKRGDGNDYYTYVIDEYTSGAADAEIHARGILSMLRRNRLEPKDIYRWTGDRSHGGDRYGGRMSNTMLRSAFEHVLGYPRGRGFRIHTAYKPSYSVYYGCRVIHEAMSRGRFQIHPRCKASLKSLKNWALTKHGRMDNMSQHKHLIDALRYAIMPVVDVQYRAPRASKIKLVR